MGVCVLYVCEHNHLVELVGLHSQGFPEKTRATMTTTPQEKAVIMKYHLLHVVASHFSDLAMTNKTLSS